MPSSLMKRSWLRERTFGVEAGVIGQRGDAGLGQRRGGLLDLGARQAVDDAGVAGVALGDEGLELRAARSACRRFRSGCSAGRSSRRTVGASASSSRSTISSRVRWSAVAVSAMRGTSGKRSAISRQADIFRAEVVAPLRHAMRLVDGEQRDPRPVEQREAARRQQPLRRDVEQVEIAGEQPLLDLGGFVESQRRIQHRRVDAGLAQRRTWSCISAISGETTMPQPSRSSAGIW